MCKQYRKGDDGENEGNRLIDDGESEVRIKWVGMY